MKFVMVLCVALMFLAVGIYDVFKEKRKTVAKEQRDKLDINQLINH